MNARDQLAAELTELLHKSPISQDEKIKALGIARNSLNNPADPNLERWREERARAGPFDKAEKKG